MPIEYEVRDGLIFTRAFQTVTPAHMRGHLERLLGDETVPRPHREVWDAREVETFDLFGTDVRELVERLGDGVEPFRDARIAVLTTDPVVYGLARSAQVYIEPLPLELQLFEGPDDARAWLEGE